MPILTLITKLQETVVTVHASPTQTAITVLPAALPVVAHTQQLIMTGAVSTSVSPQAQNIVQLMADNGTAPVLELVFPIATVVVE